VERDKHRPRSQADFPTGWEHDLPASRGQPHRATVNQGEYGQSNEGGNQKANSEIHDGFEH
jgi:hypothetical protein